MTHECTCKTCGKCFRSQKIDSTICYDCALKHFTGGRPPEESDFNSASLCSGEMTDEEVRWLQQDLESVEHDDSAHCDYPERYDDDDDFRFPSMGSSR